MKIQDVLAEKKPFTRIAYLDGNEMKFIIASELRLENGFLKLSSDDFHYSVEPVKEGKKTSININGGYPKHSKFINAIKIDQYEEIGSEDSRYATYLDIVTRSIEANCSVQISAKTAPDEEQNKILTPSKEIIIP